MYRLLSGFHASITLSICENFHNATSGESGPNTNCYYYRLGQFPDRLKNVYFNFLFLLRATQHASKFLSEYHFNTGDIVEDASVSKKVNDLLDIPLLQGCVPTFNESEMFRNDTTGDLKRQFRAKFRNIRFALKSFLGLFFYKSSSFSHSEIMDCVACESCKVHAKLNILGIGTALKILFSAEEKRDSVIQNLQRNEIIVHLLILS